MVSVVKLSKRLDSITKLRKEFLKYTWNTGKRENLSNKDDADIYIAF